MGNNKVAVDGIERMYADDLYEAVELARDKDGKTWLTLDGKVVAAIVPPEVVALYERVTHPAIAGPPPVRLAEKIIIERVPRPSDETPRPVRMWIDGKLFEYGTLDGFHINPRRTEQPGVTLTIAAASVEVRDSV